VAGCGLGESTHHLFLHCEIFGSLWQYIRDWIGISGVDPFTLQRRSIMQMLWLLCVWIVWNERNNRIFKNTQTNIIDLMEKVKYHLFWWLKANNVKFVYGTIRWWSDPLLSLGID